MDELEQQIDETSVEVAEAADVETIDEAETADETESVAGADVESTDEAEPDAKGNKTSP
jgi:hypothetical protein